MSNNIIVGVDEAGRGPWAGPVIAAAVYLPGSILENKIILAKIKDSKKMSPSQREEVCQFLKKEAVWGLGAASSLYIDQNNILQATFWAMRQSIFNLQSKLPLSIQKVLVDGNQEIPNLPFAQKAIVKGDSLEKSIAAASIIAKVTRDHLMQSLDQKYPQYGFAEHKGYGTIIHKEALLRWGPCFIHRRSFRPINAI